MGKVVTSEGLTEFVQSGKFTSVPNHKAKSGDAPPLEVVKATPTLEVGSPGGEKKPEVKPTEKTVETPAKVAEADVEELTAEEKALPEKAQKEIQRSKRAVNEKHRLMKVAQEAAEDAERFAETQFNEKTLVQKRADAAEARVKELEAKLTPPVPEAKEPDIADYKDAQGNYDWVKFQKDTSKYAADQAIKGERQRQADEATNRDKQVRLDAMKANADKVREAHPDFDEVMRKIANTDADKVPAFVLSFIEESENSAAVAYHLATNPEVSQKIAKMRPILGIAELGKLEDTLVKPPSAAAKDPAANSVTARIERGGAPAPITPLTGEGTVGINTDPSTMSYKELREYHRAKRAEKRH